MASNNEGGGDKNSYSRRLFEYLDSGTQYGEIELAKPKPGLDEEVEKIFKQANKHRDTLIRFYIWYTSLFSCFIALIILFQVFARLYGSETIEVIPQWALYLLITGMFGQFVSLLAIVTRKVWTFDPFLGMHSAKNNLQKKSKV